MNQQSTKMRKYYHSQIQLVVITLFIAALHSTCAQEEVIPLNAIENPLYLPCLADFGDSQKAWGPKSLTWKKSVVTFSFIPGEGSVDLQRKIAKTASAWNGIADIKVQWVEGKRADIRIAFQKLGHWSTVGRASQDVPLSRQTMNLQLDDQSSESEIRRVTLHEFGHALGFSHEHQNPKATIVWNVPAVISYYSGSPNYWNEAQIEHNVLRKYSSKDTFGTDFDPKSIMLYPIPRSMTLNGFSSGWNSKISDMDRKALQLAYPNSVAIN